MATLRDPPRIPGPPIIGNTLRLIRDPLGFTLECASGKADVVDMNVRFMTIYLVNNPELIEQALVTRAKSFIKDKGTRSLSVLLGRGLLTSDGDFWRRQRRLAQPGFHRDRIASYGAVMVEYTDRMLRTWRPGETRDVHSDMMSLTREIVAKTLFGLDITQKDSVIGEAFEAIVQRFQDVPPGIPIIDKLPTASKRRFDDAVRTLDEIIYRFIAERRASGRDTGDLLSMLIGARDDSGGQMSELQIRDEAMTLFLAGHETTAAALSWTFMLLSENLAAYEALGRELDDVLKGRLPTFADLPSLKYTDWVIHESMRLMPPAWAIGREATEDCEIGDYRVPKGVQLWFSQYTVHRDDRYYDDPLAFRPERWSGDFAKKLPKFAYFPFGGGARLCIGSSFALMEATLLLATIAQKFRVIVPKQKIEKAAAVTLRPIHGVRVVLESR
jgi:cytochrome P450